jgi:phosphoribosylamine--glycine ligase
VILRLKSDLVPLLEATIEGRLDKAEAEWHKEASVCIVLCAGGYPGPYEKGKEIRGLEKLERWQRGVIFHAGTTRKDGRWWTAGGRVLGVTALASPIEEAVREAYRAVGEIQWDGIHYRKDIGQRAIKKNKG